MKFTHLELIQKGQWDGDGNAVVVGGGIESIRHGTDDPVDRDGVGVIGGCEAGIACEHVLERETQNVRVLALRALAPHLERLAIGHRRGNTAFEHRDERTVVRHHVAAPRLVPEPRDLCEEFGVLGLKGAPRSVFATNERMFDEHLPGRIRCDGRVVHVAISERPADRRASLAP